NVRDDILSNGVNSASVLDCVDSIVALVGHPNLAAVGPEAYRHYSWSFNLTVSKRPTSGRTCEYVRDERASSIPVSIPVNPIDVALLARYDHVVAKCAKMVERNPAVVR